MFIDPLNGHFFRYYHVNFPREIKNGNVKYRYCKISWGSTKNYQAIMKEKTLVPVPYSCVDRKNTGNAFEWCENVDIKNNIAWCDFNLYDYLGDDCIQA
jgi:hypothetical protein